MQQPDRITAAEVMRRINRKEKLIFVDVREPESWASSEELIGGAMRVPPSEIAAHAGRIPRNLLVIYCDSEHELTSMNVARELLERGFPNVFVLEGGLDAWRQTKGFIVSKPAGGDVHTAPAKLPESAQPKQPGRLPQEGVAARGEPSTPMANLPSPHHRPSHA
jgi:rhodanese-related sulfurtransferase